MHVKTFTGKSITTLLSQVKEEFGSDAVVLSTREFRDNNQTLHEMVVGIEENSPLITSTYTKKGTEKNITHLEDDEAQGYTTNTPSANPSLEAWQKTMMSEILSLKESIYTILRPNMKFEALTVRQRIALEYLLQEGVTEHIAMMLYKKMLQEPENAPIDTLSEIISLRPWGAEQWRNRLHGVVGTSGVGKSSVVLRMASKLSQENPELRILILNIDTEKSYGKFFLRYFSGLSNIAYQEATTKEELHEVLRTSTAERVLLDIPVLPTGYTLARYLRMYGLEHANIHIVLGAGSSKHQIEDTLEQYKVETQGSIVWTKLDEVSTYGTVLNTSIVSGLPISSFSYGASIQNSLVSVNEAILWNIIFKHQLPQ